MTDDIELQNAAGQGQDLPPNTRRLLRLVYIMGVVLVVLLIVLIGGIIWKATSRPAPKAASGPAIYDLGLAGDETIASVAIDGDRLAVTTNRGIIIVDVRRNTVTARIGFRPQ